MELFTFVIALICFVNIYAADPPGGYYATRYDHFDVDAVLNNKRLVSYYSSCLLSTGPCPPQGVDFKRILPEALQTNCLRCTEKQKVVTLRTIRRLRKEYPKVWVDLSALWDPNDEYIRRFEDSFAAVNIIPESFVHSRFPDINENVSVTAPPKATASRVNVLSANVPTAKPFTTAPIIPDTINTTPFSKKLPPVTVRVSNSASQSSSSPKPPSTTPKIVNPLSTNTVSFGGTILPSFEASTRFGINLLGSLGTKVVEVGTKIAGMVLSTVQNVVGI